jgi:hypothetical protein
MKLITTLILSLCATYTFSQSDVRLNMVDTEIGLVELINLGDASQNLATWQLCRFPTYQTIGSMTVLQGSTTIAAGATLLVFWSPIIGNDGELGLYNSASFGSSTAIQDYVEWGSAGHFREPVAVGAGVWSTGDFISGSGPFTFTGGAGDYGIFFWSSVIEGCTYPEATNYDSTATVDDGTCLFDAPCQTDFNNDLITDTTDLLIFLAAFGQPC